MKAGTIFKNTTLVWLREEPRDNGTEFIIADDPKTGGKPVQVDIATALGWQRMGWIEVVKNEAKAKPTP